MLTQEQKDKLIQAIKDSENPKKPSVFWKGINGDVFRIMGYCEEKWGCRNVCLLDTVHEHFITIDDCCEANEFVVFSQMEPFFKDGQ